MTSLRSRLVIFIAVGITAILTGGGYMTYDRVRARAWRELDRGLETVARSIAANVGHAMVIHRKQLRPRPDDWLDPIPLADDLTIWVLRPDGEPIGSRGPHADADPPPLEVTAEPSFATTTLASAAGSRVVALSFRPPAPRELGRGLPARFGRPLSERLGELARDRPPRDGDGADADEEPDRRPISLYVARDVGDLEVGLAHLRDLLTITWLASVLATILIVSFVVHRGLAPVIDLQQQLGELDEKRLDHRVAVAGAPTEITPVIEQLNVLLARLEGAFEREKRFNAHAAHELRTPLAGIRAILEVSLGRARAPDEHREAERECLEVTMQMQAVVESLLDLARLESGELAIEREPVALADLVASAVRSYRSAASERNLCFENAVDANGVVTTSRPLARRVVDNVIENAVCYADRATAIRVRSGQDEDAAWLAVENVATAAPADLAERAFDAFWRADAARTETGQHAGLGLALCRRILRALDGTVAATYDGARFTVRIRWPRPPAAANDGQSVAGR